MNNDEEKECKSCGIFHDADDPWCADQSEDAATPPTDQLLGVGCSDLLASLSDDVESVQDAIFEREGEFLEKFCKDKSHTLTGFWIGSENCKIVWIEESGQHLTDTIPTKSVILFLANDVLRRADDSPESKP